MTDAIKIGANATQLLLDDLLEQYTNAAILDIEKQLDEIPLSQTEQIVRLVALRRHVKGFNPWLVGKTRTAQWAKRDLKKA